jgi:hypothetical protein
MKSSSELFPTQLIKADVIENLSSRFEEEPLEKKSDKKRCWHSPAKASENLRSRSVILVHGCYQ